MEGVAATRARRRLTLALAGALALLLALVGVERLLQGARERRQPPALVGAEWIWTAAGRHHVGPVAFYAAADLVLETPPREARLLVAADEEYVLFVNGTPVGLNRRGVSPVLDLYEVAAALRPGVNRLVAELRSARGTGGFLLALVDEAGRPLLASGPAWRLFHLHGEGLLSGELPLAAGVAPHSWGPHPAGRWRLAAGGRARPTVGELFPAGYTFATHRAVEEIAPHHRLFDWGETVCGYPRVELDAPLAGPALVETRREPGESEVGPAHEVAIPIAGLLAWQAARPRCFRYLLWVAPEAPRAAAVLRLPEATAHALASPPLDGEGIFGIEPPRLRTPAQDEVRRRLERVPGVAGGEGG